MVSIKEFIARVEDIPWFENVGNPSERDSEVFRIYDWSTWPGPEDPAVSLQNDYYMMWHDRLFCGIDEQQKVQLEKVWDEIETIVFDVARSKVPYSDEQDAWYAPNAAVWSGGWIAALVVCTLIQQGKIEENKSTPEYQWTLGNIWSWFKAGHWPCSFYWTYSQDLEQAERTGAPKLLVIY